MINKDRAHLDQVDFYCPNCYTKLYQMQHVEYECECGLTWITPAPMCLTIKCTKPIREINGEKR